MGRIRSYEMLEFAGFDAALADHLTANHYPPISNGESFARLAIEEAVNDRWDEVITLDGRRGIVAEIIEDWHLEPFVEHRLGADLDA